jgi:hypothetical protein
VAIHFYVQELNGSAATDAFTNFPFIRNFWHATLLRPSNFFDIGFMSLRE